jgi:hypothetical protein
VHRHTTEALKMVPNKPAQYGAEDKPPMQMTGPDKSIKDDTNAIGTPIVNPSLQGVPGVGEQKM